MIHINTHITLLDIHFSPSFTGKSGPLGGKGTDSPLALRLTAPAIHLVTSVTFFRVL